MMRKMRSGMTVLVALVAMVMFIPLTGYSQTGVGTPGFWKNHPEAWPIAIVPTAGITYNQNSAIYYMSNPSKGDKTYELYSHLVAAILNMYNGADATCIADTIKAANGWLAKNYLASGVEKGSLAWVGVDGGEQLKDLLDAYNNGELCAPLRD